jgi:lipopolysaccharide/colanic/teichoic acid biosynthesis glycosyltransferase
MDGLVVATHAEQSQAARERIRPRRILVGLDAIAGCLCLVWLEVYLRLRLRDRYYLDNWSLKLDMSIVLRTFLVVLRGKGAY